MLDFLRENWPLISALIAAVLAGKWGLVLRRALKLVMKEGEGEINRSFRNAVALQAEDAPNAVRDVIANVAASVDPDPKKRPEHKGKAFAKLLGRTALTLFTGGIR
jgi:hypothetical protein